MSKILGMLLMLLGIYFLGQDIIVTTQTGYYWYRWIPADASILAIMSGIICILFMGETVGKLGWILLAIGVVLVFLSGGLILRGTSLWDFIIAFVAIASGYQLMTQGRIRF